MVKTLTMTRYEESKIPELDSRLDNLERSSRFLEDRVRELRRKDDMIKEIEIVDLPFHPDKYRTGVLKLNQLLEKGMEIFRQFQTDGGIVVELARWGKRGYD